jgi:hypothetical protein
MNAGENPAKAGWLIGLPFVCIQEIASREIFFSSAAGRLRTDRSS